MSTEPEPVPAPQSGPKFTERLTMHLNGGSDYSVLEYEVFADAQPTGIRHLKRTDGSPKYFITANFFRCGSDEFDVMETKGVGLMAWLLAHTKPAKEEGPAPSS